MGVRAERGNYAMREKRTLDGGGVVSMRDSFGRIHVGEARRAGESAATRLRARE